MHTFQQLTTAAFVLFALTGCADDSAPSPTVLGPFDGCPPELRIVDGTHIRGWSGDFACDAIDLARAHDIGIDAACASSLRAAGGASAACFARARLTRSVVVARPPSPSLPPAPEPCLVHISVDASGQIEVNDMPVTLEALDANLRFSCAGNKRAIISADRAVAYERVIEVMDALRRAEIGAISFKADRGPR